MIRKFNRINFLSKAFFFFSFLFSFSSLSQAQSLYEPLNQDLKSFNIGGSMRSSDFDSLHFSSFNAQLESQTFQSVKSYRSYLSQNESDENFLEKRKYKEYSWFRRKLLYENFIIIDTGILYITIDPLMNLSAGRESSSQLPEDLNLYTNTRGLIIKGDIGKKISFETYFYENQAKLPNYLNDFVSISDVVPGQGRVKSFKEGAFDFSQSGGYFSYSPIANFNVQFGHHKHFIGDGYRSLILSDNSFNYPFLRLNASFFKKKLRYSVLYALFQDLVRTPSAVPSEAIFRRKGGTYHFLEYEFSKKFRLNLTQGIIWPFENVNNGEIKVDYSLLNPIMFSYSLFDFKSKNNLIMAIGSDLKLFRRLEIYNQFAMGGSNTKEGNAFQIGTRIYPIKNSFLLIEGNWIQNEIYANTHDDYFNAFVHYNEALAQKNFNDVAEIILRLGYRYKRLLPTLQVNRRKHVGSEWDTIIKMEMAYILNPSTNLKIFASYTKRTLGYESQNVQTSSDIIYFGIKTDLRNIYYDF